MVTNSTEAWESEINQNKILVFFFPHCYTVRVVESLSSHQLMHLYKIYTLKH